ncbi:hypothetical protein GGQ80_001346 [Sphingomonas jinjuensis]|uniref:Uncharacterized protein n=1 Tax=Sphingomonas jinjuensis TaxID=535907 RepID=A0A840FCF7_9SPHN|nr:hypothetical protein [Sphingomonas jinjuensis]MBB4153444.1 hypothetical protein [Sphingomonas jinjuensis]
MAPHSDAPLSAEDIRRELLHRAIALGEELVRLADDLGEPVAGNHICQGIEMMRLSIATPR